MGIFAKLFEDRLNMLEKEDRDVSDKGQPEAEPDTMPPKEQTAK